MATIVGASTETSDRSYRLAFGPNAGLGAPAETNDLKDHAFNDNDIEIYRTDLRGPVANRLGQPRRFSLHADVACKTTQRKKLERPGGAPLCRYITRPAISERRMSLAANGSIVYQDWASP